MRFNIYYHNIQKDAVDPNYYRYGEVSVGYAQLEIHNRPNPFLNYYLRTALKTGIQKWSPDRDLYPKIGQWP